MSIFVGMNNDIKTSTTLSKNLKPFVAIMGVVVGILLINDDFSLNSCNEKFRSRAFHIIWKLIINKKITPQKTFNDTSLGKKCTTKITN